MSETHSEKRARKRAAAALASGRVPHPADLLPKKLANRALARRLHLLLAASQLKYRTDLVSILTQYRTALAGALEAFHGGWDPRATAVEAHYLWQLPAMVGRVFDAMWPLLVACIQAQAKEQGLVPVIPDPAPWRQESINLMDKSAKELGMDMRRGETADDIGVGRARVIAEDQIGKIAAQGNQLAQVTAGVDSFVWSGVMDDREREEHVALEGAVLSWAEGADGLFPGQAVNCRCISIPVRS